MVYDSISPLGLNPEALKVGHLILLNQNFTLRMPLVVQTSTTTMSVVYCQYVSQQTPHTSGATEEGGQRTEAVYGGGG